MTEWDDTEHELAVVNYECECGYFKLSNVRGAPWMAQCPVCNKVVEVCPDE